MSDLEELKHHGCGNCTHNEAIDAHIAQDREREEQAHRQDEAHRVTIRGLLAEVNRLTALLRYRGHEPGEGPVTISEPALD